MVTWPSLTSKRPLPTFHFGAMSLRAKSSSNSFFPAAAMPPAPPPASARRRIRAIRVMEDSFRVYREVRPWGRRDSLFPILLPVRRDHPVGLVVHDDGLRVGVGLAVPGFDPGVGHGQASDDETRGRLREHLRQVLEIRVLGESLVQYAPGGD